MSMFLDPFTKGHPTGLFTRLKRYFYPSRNQESAGCVLVNSNQVLLIHRGSFYNDWTFPKGKIEQNRDPEQEAVRETIEEVGIKPKIIKKLSPNRYSYYVDEERIRINTTVHYYFATSNNRIFDLQKNVDKKEAATFLEAKWVGFDEAIKLVSHDTEKYLLKEANSMLANI